MTTQDNRAAWMTKTAKLRAADEGAWFARFCAGQKIKQRIEPRDLTLDRLLSLGRQPAPAVNIETARAKRRGRA